MKTTIDIPDTLYRQAKIKAVKRGTTLKALVLAALASELEDSSRVQESEPAYLVKRRLLPEFARLEAEGAFQGGRDSADIISEDRDDRW